MVRDFKVQRFFPLLLVLSCSQGPSVPTDYEQKALVFVAGFNRLVASSESGTLEVYYDFLKVLDNPEVIDSLFSGIPLDTVRESLWPEAIRWDSLKVAKSELDTSGQRAWVWVASKRDTQLVELVKRPSGWKAVLYAP